MARNFLVGALICVALALAPAAGAQERKKEYPIDVSRQAVTPALEQLNRQTQIYYGYSPSSPEEEQIVVGPVKGTYTIEEALRRLLKPTGLTFTWITSRTISIHHPPPPPEVETPPQARRQRVLRRPQHATPRTSNDQGGILGTVTVEGRAPPTLGQPSGSIVLLDRAAIDNSGVSTLFDVIKLIPQQPFLRPDGFRANGAQYIELRGLGVDTSMVLISDRRAFASAASYVANAFDLNTIPLSAVEQVEVLLDTTSVRHGSDAIGGIVNIVLRDTVPEPVVEIHHGGSEGGGDQLTASVRVGHQADDSKVALLLDYSAVQTLLGAERDLWSNQDYRRFGSFDLRSINSSPGNVSTYVPPMAPLSLAAATLPGYSSAIAAIPERISGDSAQLGELLPGQRNYESLLRYFPIVPASRRASAILNAQASLTSDVGVSAEVMYVDRSIRYPFTPPVVPGLPVLLNPYNPFAGPVVVNTLLEGIGPSEQNVESQLTRGVGSIHGQARAWDWDVSLLRSEEDAQQWTENLLDFTRVTQALNNPDPDQALNVFRPGPAGSPELLRSLVAAPSIETFATDASQVTAFANGGVAALPAGPLTLTFGGEWRKESVQFDAALDSFGREVAAGFAELNIPLLGESDLSMSRELVLTIAGRFDDYSDFGGFLNPHYGLVWRPSSDWTVRASYARSFRPPSMFELYFPKLPRGALNVSDPRRAQETALAAVVSGGNPDLDPTRGKSFTAGVEFQPLAIEPLKLSATYWHIAMDKRVTLPLQPTFVLANEALFQDRVVRAQPTAADLAAGLPGSIQQLDLSRMNFGRLTTSGVDLGASYQFDSAWGRFGASLMTTWIDQFETIDVQPTAASRVDLANDVIGTITKWRAIAGLDWQRAAFASTARLRYIPSYDDTLGGARTGRTISAQTFLDLQFAIDIEKLVSGDFWRGLRLAAGAANILDQQPPFAEVAGAQGYDTSQGDLRGRFWYLRLGKTF